jgi:YesN/AraC family two-component response regulator
MTLFQVETYVIKPEKQQEYRAIVKKWAAYIKENKEKCKEMKSWKLFSQMTGGSAGGYVEMGEFESLADYEKFTHRTFHGHDKFITAIVLGFTACVVPGTYSMNIWNSVM